ncbi:unnamed protein product [Zymoseptoria tritici ST99CH_1E4]|uniref:Uncharacterized protein n=1 Tax=Zymoseptoria tritici ST99CH_1E4 TaxID=1276532 RepID=A0A2H1GNY2_ZYMTR|nr:unnamed protein product [Zymoseptoria tritici ST99CH_1E4]
MVVCDARVNSASSTRFFKTGRSTLRATFTTSMRRGLYIMFPRRKLDSVDEASSYQQQPLRVLQTTRELKPLCAYFAELTALLLLFRFGLVLNECSALCDARFSNAEH